MVVEAGEEIEFAVMYSPGTAIGPELGIIRVASNDPAAPFVDLPVRGTLGTPSLATVVGNSGDFGNVCVGSFKDEELTIDNNGTCPLSIFNISGSPEFLAPSVASYPLVVNPGSSLQVVIRFQPSAFGAKAGLITLVSSDPASPLTILVRGVAPAPQLSLMIVNSGNFGETCVGSFTDEPLTLANSGPCKLTITGMTSSSPEFLVPEVLVYPLVIAAGVSMEVPIRFQPASFGAKAATITVLSDDPVGPKSLDVTGFAPSGTLAVTGSTNFGGVTACCCADRTISICNVGDCSLHVTSVRFKRKSRHWKLLLNPFPAKLHPGSCLSVIIRYKATERCPRCCELIIESDDPVTPIKSLEVLAYTIWADCRCK